MSTNHTNHANAFPSVACARSAFDLGRVCDAGSRLFVWFVWFVDKKSLGPRMRGDERREGVTSAAP
jgi:hypothetical protein